MIIRFVKMTFQEQYVEEFLAKLDERKERIRSFEGCQYLQILQDVNDQRIIFSHSYWDSEAALDNYRHSDFFQETWAFTKPKFAEKAEAWSMESLHELKDVVA